MTSRDFCYWLQGALELGGITSLDFTRTSILKNHLNMVFVHEIDPSFPQEQQEALNESHRGSLMYEDRIYMKC